MNLRQRRGVMFLGGSSAFLLVGASALSGYVSDVNEQVGPVVTVVTLARDVDAYDPLTEDDVETTEVPRRWLPEGTISSEEEALGQVAVTDLQAGAHLTEDVLIGSPELSPGEREIAILIDAETGVAGKVVGGSRVDIVATFGDEIGGAGRSEIIVSNAQVLDVGDLQVENSDDDEVFEQTRVVPVTFALSVDEALILTHAESFAQQVRLALIAPTDVEPIPEADRTYTGADTAGAGE